MPSAMGSNADSHCAPTHDCSMRELPTIGRVPGDQPRPGAHVVEAQLIMRGASDYMREARKSEPLARAAGTAPQQPVQPAPSRDFYGSPFEADAQNVQRVSDYAGEVFSQLFRDEAALLPRPNYMEEQADINGKMRGILVDWLVEVHMKYRLRPETLFLAVNIIDRYLSLRAMVRKRLQLLGVVAMFIAAKFEEIDPPKVAEFAYITDNSYTKKDILSFECTVLVALGFQIAVPTAAHFLDRLQQANGCDAVHKALAQYVLELALLDLSALRHPPSLLVGASLLLSNELLGRRPVWPAVMVHHARRSEASLRPCAEELRLLFGAARTSSMQAVRRKYQLDQNYAVANFSPVRHRV